MNIRIRCADYKRKTYSISISCSYYTLYFIIPSCLLIPINGGWRACVYFAVRSSDIYRSCRKNLKFNLADVAYVNGSFLSNSIVYSGRPPNAISSKQTYRIIDFLPFLYDMTAMDISHSICICPITFIARL